MEKTPWVSFCMSTYKRPKFLKNQIASLLSQTYTDFEIVISDNDPEGSGKSVVSEFHDKRVKYFRNDSNLGMIPSFNKSIDRSTTEYVVMVTDDDPVLPIFLNEMNAIRNNHPGFALYGGFTRRDNNKGDFELIAPQDFIEEILDPAKTPWLLWSSCCMKRSILIEVGKIPDYGSPHLADHALIAMAGSSGGAVVVNRRFSELTSHDSNFSKFNFDSYVNGCKGFFETMNAFCSGNKVAGKAISPVRKHLHHWFLTNIFTLKRYYTVNVPDNGILREVETSAEEMMNFEFMKDVRIKYRLKNMIFHVKNALGMLTKMP